MDRNDLHLLDDNILYHPAKAKHPRGKQDQFSVKFLAVDRADLNPTNPIIPIAIIDSVPGSGTDDAVAVNCPEKEAVTVPPPPTVPSKSWKLWPDSGIVNTPLIGTVSPVRLSSSSPRIANEAVELVADRFAKSNGD